MRSSAALLYCGATWTDGVQLVVGEVERLQGKKRNQHCGVHHLHT